MAVRWQITFRTLSERTGRIDIHDSSYAGDPIQLEPAQSPLYIDSSQEGLFAPVVSETGYIRFIDDGIASAMIDDIYPSDAMDRKVMYYIDNNLAWQGYISPENYSQAWEPTPREVNLPLVGALGALESVTIPDTGEGMMTIAALLQEILAATGVDWSHVYYPIQMLGVGSEDIVAPEMRMSVSRYNFIDTTESVNRDDPDWTPTEGQSYLDILTEICRYFGWSAVMQANDLVLTTPIPEKHRYWSIIPTELAALALDYQATVTRRVITRHNILESRLQWDGSDHKESVTNGYRKVVVQSSANRSADIYPKAEFGGRQLKEYTRTAGLFSSDSTHPFPPTYERTSRLVFLDPDVDTYLYSYVLDGSGMLQPVRWHAPGNTTELPLVSGAMVRCDMDGQDGKKNWSFTDYIRLSVSTSFAARNYTNEMVPLCTIKSRKIGLFPSSGAIAISGSCLMSYVYKQDRGSSAAPVYYPELTGAYPSTPFANGVLRAQLRIGEWYWDGNLWTKSVRTFEIHLDSQGNIPDQKTLDMPYNGAAGLIIPMKVWLAGQEKDINFTGRMELTLYPFVTTSNDTFGPSVYISNLQVGYYNDADASAGSSVRVAAVTGSRFRDDLNVNLKLTSNDARYIGLATLWWGDSPVSSDLAVRYATGSTEPSNSAAWQSGVMIPEKNLLDSLVHAYAGTSHKLELEVEYDSSLKRYDKVTLQGKVYVITAIRTDFQREHSTLTIERYE